MPTTSQPPLPGNGLITAADGVSLDVNPQDASLVVSGAGVKVGTISSPQVTDIDPNVGAMNLAGWV